MADSNVTKKTSLLKRIKRFFTETKSELKKAVWPTKEQLIHNTGVILVFIIVVAVILFVLDAAFAGVFSKIQELFI